MTWNQALIYMRLCKYVEDGFLPFNLSKLKTIRFVYQKAVLVVRIKTENSQRILDF